jgi:hypothetical protein
MTVERGVMVLCGMLASARIFDCRQIEPARALAAARLALLLGDRQRVPAGVQHLMVWRPHLPAR